MIISLIRDLAGPDFTSGVMTLPTGLRLYTIERPWLSDPLCKSGQKYRSCVADGDYKVVKHASEKFGNVWALVNHDLDVYHWPGEVPKGREESTRTAILIHAGNWSHDVIGCIAVGQSRIGIGDSYMVQRSRAALTDFRRAVAREPSLGLRIRWNLADKVSWQ